MINQAVKGQVETILNAYPAAMEEACARARCVVLQLRGFAMIEHSKGNLLTADAEALVNTVNCVGLVPGQGDRVAVQAGVPGELPRL